MLIGGNSPGVDADTEIWDGTSWAEVNNLNTAREALSASGSSTLAIAFGGTPPVKANTEVWNGTSWTEINDLSTARAYMSQGGGTSGSATGTFAAAGYTTTAVTTVEEWTVDAAVATVTTS